MLARLLAAALAFSAVACGGQLGTGEVVADLCEPGDELLCECPGGSASTRACRDDGDGFSRCQCSTEPDDDAPLPDLGSECGSHADCTLDRPGTERVCDQDAGCAEGCMKNTDCGEDSVCVRNDAAPGSCS